MSCQSVKDHLLASFFSEDPDEALRALPALAGAAGETDRSHGAVTGTETLRSVRGEERLRADRRGIFSEVVFGPALDDRCACGATRGEASRGVTCPRCGVLCDRASLRDERWGHVDVTSVVHPSVRARLHDALGLLSRDVRLVLHGEKALRAVNAGDGPRWTVISADDMGDDDLTGPGGVLEAVRRAAPDHPFLPLCALSKVPVPPPGDRPFAPITAPTQVDPWMGPLNEAWVALVERASRERRLVELAAPDIILRNESVLVQRAFDTVVDLTRRAFSRLVPPLVRPPEGLEHEAPLFLAFAGEERLVLQRREGVLVLDLQGNVVSRLPPAGTILRGVQGGRYAVFEGFFPRAHPMLAQGDTGFGPDFVHVDESGCIQMAPVLGEISVVDCETGAYLEHPPPGLRLRFVQNDQPEDLFLTAEDGQPIRRLRVGGDRPTVLAYAPGMQLAWVGEEDDSTEVIDLDSGVPHAYPCEPGDTRVSRWSLLPSAPGEDEGAHEDDEDDEDEDDDRSSANAVAFRNGAWRFLWSSGILCDHRARRPVRLDPLPEAAAFDPSGRNLALVVRDTVLLADVARRRVTARFPLPS